MAQINPLVREFAFDEEDIQALRGGFLSDKAKDKLRAVWKRQFIVAGILIIATVLPLLLCVGTLIFANTNSTSQTPLLFGGLVIAGVLALGALKIGLPLLRKAQRAYRDVNDGQVNSISGEGTVLISYSGRGVDAPRTKHLQLRIEDQTFNVDRWWIGTPENGAQFRAFYLPTSKILIALEKL